MQTVSVGNCRSSLGKNKEIYHSFHNFENFDSNVVCHQVPTTVPYLPAKLCNSTTPSSRLYFCNNWFLNIVSTEWILHLYVVHSPLCWKEYNFIHQLLTLSRLQTSKIKPIGNMLSDFVSKPLWNDIGILDSSGCGFRHLDYIWNYMWFLNSGITEV